MATNQKTAAQDVRTVEVPSSSNWFDAGWPRKIDLTLAWACPACGGPRGEVFRTHSFDGSRRQTVDGWKNPCGHVDMYADVRQEAATNGLNGPYGRVGLVRDYFEHAGGLLDYAPWKALWSPMWKAKEVQA